MGGLRLFKEIYQTILIRVQVYQLQLAESSLFLALLENFGFTLSMTDFNAAFSLTDFVVIKHNIHLESYLLFIYYCKAIEDNSSKN